MSIVQVHIPILFSTIVVSLKTHYIIISHILQSKESKHQSELQNGLLLGTVEHLQFKEKPKTTFSQSLYKKSQSYHNIYFSIKPSLLLHQTMPCHYPTASKCSSFDYLQLIHSSQRYDCYIIPFSYL